MTNLFRGVESSFKKWILRTLVGVFVIGWLVLSITALQCALTFSCSAEAASFWEILIATIGVPIVVYQLYSLRDTIQRQQQQPVIQIGLREYPVVFSEIDPDQPLKTELNLQTNNKEARLELLIRNQGDRVARFVKIVLELFDMGEGTSLPGMKFDTSREATFISTASGRDHVFKGDTNWLIYPHDFEKFTVIIVPHAGDTGLHHIYHFRCYVWAEGLQEAPASQELEIVIS